MKRLLAAVLTVAVVLPTPGLPFYAALAHAAAPIAARPGAGAAGAQGAAGAAASAPASLAGAVPTLPAASLSGLSGLQTSLQTAIPAPFASLGAVHAPGALPSALAAPAAVGASGPAATAPAGESHAAPRTFATVAGEEAGALFDQSRTRSSAFEAIPLPAASAPEGPGLRSPAAPSAEPAPGVPAAPEPPKPESAKLPRSAWGLYWGHHVMTVFGVNFHVLSQPFLVKDALGFGTAAVGLTRNIHMGSMALVNLLPIGMLIDKTDYRVVYVATSLARAFLMGAIPMLFMSGALPFTVLALIVAANPLFQSVMIVADAAGRKSFVGKDPKLNKEVAAVFGKWDAVLGAIMPLAAGAAIGALVSTFGVGGYAMAYGVYAVLLLAAIPFYWLMVRDARFPENDRLGLGGFAVQSGRFLGALLWSVAAAALLLPKALLKGALALPRLLKDRGAKGSLADALDKNPATEGLAYILRNRVLRILTAVMALEVLLIDALPFVLIPSLVSEVLAGAPAAGLPAWAATAGGLMGVLFSIEYLGRFLPAMRLEGEKGDKIIEKSGHGRFYRRAALASLLFWALLLPVHATAGMFWPSLAIIAGVLFTVQYFHSPVSIVMEPVKRAQMDDDKLARIESAIFMTDVAFQSVGALALGLLLDLAGLTPALIATALFLTATAYLQYNVPKWIFPDGERPAKPAPPAPGA